MRVLPQFLIITVGAQLIGHPSSASSAAQALLTQRSSVQLNPFDTSQYKDRTDGKGYYEKSTDQVFFVTDYLESKAWVIIDNKRIEMGIDKRLSGKQPDYMTVKNGTKYYQVYRNKELSAIVNYTLINRWDACDFVRLEYRIDLTISNGSYVKKYVLFNTTGG